MKIIHFFPWTSWGTLGGTEKYIIEIASYQSIKHQVSIAYPLAGSKSTIVVKKDKYDEISLPNANPNNNRLIGYGIKESSGLRAWDKLLSCNEFDIVHFHCYEPYQLKYVKVAHKNSLKTVFTPHVVNFTCVAGTLINGMTNSVCDGELRSLRCTRCSLSHRKASWVEKNKQKFNLFLKKWNFKTVVGNFDKIIVLNQDYFDVLITNKIPQQKLVLIKPKVLPSFKIRSKNQILEKLRVVYIGRLSKLKGVDNLLEACEYLKDRNISLSIYGPPGDIELVNYESANIQYKGIFPFSEVATILSRYHSLILPSVSYEMMPLVIQEAINSGLYIVGTNVPGIKEIMEQGVNGKIIPKNSINAIVDALIETKEHFRTNQHIRVESFEELTERINKVYEDICN